jgi:hypothetical protein
MSSPTSPVISVIPRLDSSPVRRRIMTATPFVLATRQSSTEDENYSTISSIQANRGPNRSPKKSTHFNSNFNSNSRSSPSHRSISPVKRQNSNDMTDNVIYTSSSFSVNRDQLNESTRRKQLRNRVINSEINSDMPSPQEKVCNRFGFFIDTHEAQVLP